MATDSDAPGEKKTDDRIEHLPDYKKKYFELRAELDAKFGPISIVAPLSERQEKEADAVREAAEPIKGVYSRVSEEDLQRIVQDVVDRVTIRVKSELTPARRQVLIGMAVSYLLGVMQNATWDALKAFWPMIKNIFMAAEVTAVMKEAAERAAVAHSLLPEDMRNFVDENNAALHCLRAQTWNRLQAEIEDSELRTALDSATITMILEGLENRLSASPY